MPRKNLPLIVGVVIGVAIFGGYIGWAIGAANDLAGGWASLIPIWPFVVGGALAVAALTAGFMWLAFYSSRRGYDDQTQDGSR